MARVAVDFSQVEEFPLVDEGQYYVEITGAEYREAQTEDKYDYVNVEVTIREDGEFQGSKVWDIWSLSPKALFRMKAALEQLDLLEDEIEIDYDEETMQVTEPEVVGLMAYVTIGHEKYEGRTRARIEGWESADESAPAAEEEPEAEPDEPEAPPARTRKTASASSKSKSKASSASSKSKTATRRRFT